MLYFLCGLTSILYLDLLFRKSINTDNEVFYSKNEKDYIIVDKVINF